LRKQRNFQTSIAWANVRETQRLSRVAARYHDRVIKRALSLAGIDFSEIEKRQTSDAARLATLARSQKRKLIEHGRIIARQHSDTAKALLAGLDRPDTTLRRPPKTFALRPVEIDYAVAALGRPTDPVVTTQTVSAGRVAKVRLQLAAANSRDAYQNAGCLVDFHFPWTSDRNGTINVFAVIALNGSYQIVLDPAYDPGRGATVSLTSTLWVSQNTFKSPFAEMQLLDRKVSAPGISSGIIDTGPCCPYPYNDISTLSVNDFFVSIGDPVLITVALGIYGSLIGTGNVDVDFATGDFQLDIPYLLLFAF
jgi:hypothetical protein